MYNEEQRLINHSSLSEFVLLKFSEIWELQIVHFIGFLFFYLITVTGNFLIIFAVAFDHRLHTPMYVFLTFLAIQDVGQVSVIFPSSLTSSLRNVSHISYSGCIAQVLFYVFFLGSDLFLLTVMAYDRYVAICNPLQYEMVMNRQACLHMVLAVWISSLFYGVLHTAGTFAPSFCSNIINQFFCEIPHLFKLACSGLNLTEIVILLLSAVVALGCFIFIVVSYVHILIAVLKIATLERRQKAFSTCLPHLIVVSIFIFTGGFVHLRPTSDSTSQLDLALTMIYTMIPALMNPVIYSMRNKEIKNAVINLLQSCSGKLYHLKNYH